MPRIMGIGKVSKLSKKHKPKKAGSFQGLGVVLEGSAAKSKRYGGVGAAKKKSTHRVCVSDVWRGHGEPNTELSVDGHRFVIRGDFSGRKAAALLRAEGYSGPFKWDHHCGRK